jgi:hypothetical protein
VKNFGRLRAISSWIPQAIKLACPSIILGIYGSDLHKVLLDVLPNLWGQPHIFRPYNRLADKIVGGLALTTLLLYILREKVPLRLWVRSIPVMSQVLLAMLFVITFLSYGWDSWSLWRLMGFLGGNLLLLIMGYAVCHGEIHLRQIWSVWLVMCTVLALGGVWLLSLGLTEGDFRNELINLSNVRLGYVCAIAIIFLIATYKPRKGWRRSFFSLLGLFVFAIGTVTSGSKASLVFLSLTVLLFLLICSYLGWKQSLRVFLFIMMLFVFLISGLAYLHYSGLFALKWTISAEAFRYGIASRVYLGRYYLERGLVSPVFGIGFSQAWALGQGWSPHNALIEVFVQAGVVGLALFLSFVFATLANGWRALLRSKGDEELHRLILATFLVFVFSLMMTLTQGDMVSNRVGWLFAGMLLGVGDKYKKH